MYKSLCLRLFCVLLLASSAISFGGHEAPRVSSDLKVLEERLKNTKTKFQVELILNELDTILPPGESDQGSFLRAHLLLAGCLRSIAFRLAPLFGRSKQSRGLFQQLVQYGADQFRLMITGQNAEAFLDYFTEPLESSVPVFRKVSDFQAEVRTVWVKQITLAIEDMESLPITEGLPGPLDHHFLIGDKKSLEPNAHFFFVGPGEHAILLGQLYSALHVLHGFLAYDLEDAVKVYESLSEANTVMDRVKILRAYPKFLTLISEEDLKLSFEMQKKSIQYFCRGHGFLGKTSNSFDLQQAEAMMKGSTTLEHPSNGERLRIHLAHFYEHPIKDLKDLLPVEFDQKKTKRVYFADRTFLDITNYQWGKPTLWNLTAYEGLLSVSKESGHLGSLNSAVRVLRGVALPPGMIRWLAWLALPAN